MKALARFGSPKKLEALLEREFGTDVLDSFFVTGSGIRWPVPIMGTGASVYGDKIVPRAQPLKHKIGRYIPVARKPGPCFHMAGFASLSDLIAEATLNGKRQQLSYIKTSTITGSAAGASQSLWNVGANPPAGANAAAAAAGTAYDNTTAGGLLQADPASGDTLHLASWVGTSTVTGNLFLYDRIRAWLVSEATASNAITGTQTRYNGAAGTPTYPGGSFVTNRLTTVRAANTNTVQMTYKDQDNNTAQANTAQAMVSAAAVGRTWWTAPQWAVQLASPDIGVYEVTNITYSATSTGVSEVEHGYPLGILPCMSANVCFVLDGINSAFNLIQVQTDACLALIEFAKTATAVQTYQGLITLVSG
jgi:hypothetical protein